MTWFGPKTHNLPNAGRMRYQLYHRRSFFFILTDLTPQIRKAPMMRDNRQPPRQNPKVICKPKYKSFITFTQFRPFLISSSYGWLKHWSFQLSNSTKTPIIFEEKIIPCQKYANKLENKNVGKTIQSYFWNVSRSSNSFTYFVQGKNFQETFKFVDLFKNVLIKCYHS